MSDSNVMQDLVPDDLKVTSNDSSNDSAEDFTDDPKTATAYDGLTVRRKKAVDQIVAMAFANVDKVRESGVLPGNTLAQLRVLHDEFIEDVSELIAKL
jgi:hypothetical protein